MAVDTAELRVSPFAHKPMLVFWETTRACLLCCRHCRAEAQSQPMPGELTTSEAMALLREVRRFGEPPPVVVLTGGDLLMRADVFDLVAYARDVGLHVAAAPAVTPLLTREAVRRLSDAGVGAVSLSIDATEAVHDAIRGTSGTFQKTLEAARWALQTGMRVQVNTVVMQRTVHHLPALVQVLVQEGIPIWEVFFLIATGRGLQEESLGPEEYRDVCRFLLDVTRHGLLVRTVEGPLIRQVAECPGVPAGPLYGSLSAELDDRLGEAQGSARIGKVGTLDGDGIIFIGYDGTVTPGGFLPLRLGNVRQESLVEIYRDHPLLRAIRTRRLRGACGSCAYVERCGGSRARAFAASRDPLGADPLCPNAVSVV